MKQRVEILESLGSELNFIEETIKTGSKTGSDSSQELIGFQTLKIIKNICQKELEDFERKR